MSHTNREAARAAQSRYRAAHPERIRASYERHLETHREVIAARDRARYVAHRDERRASNRLYYAAHRAEIRAYQAAHRRPDRRERVAVLGEQISLNTLPPEVRELGLLLKQARRVIQESRRGALTP